MKKILPILTTLIIFASSSSIFAQTFDFNRAYSDYVHTFNLYRQSADEFKEAKEAYLSYRTEASRNSLVQKTRAFLTNRDLVVSTYLNAIRLRLAETTGISDYQSNVLYIKLDELVYWFQSQGQKYSQLELEESLTLNQDSQKKYQEVETFIYKTLSAILAGKENKLKTKISQQLENLKQKIAEVKLKGDKDTQVAEDWLLESEANLLKAQEEIVLANHTISKVARQDTYQQAKEHLKKSHQFLSKSNEFLQKAVFELTHE